MRMVTFGQPLQGVHLIDKPCPRLWTTLNIWLDHRTTYTFLLVANILRSHIALLQSISNILVLPFTLPLRGK